MYGRLKKQLNVWKFSVLQSYSTLGKIEVLKIDRFKERNGLREGL